MTGKTSIKGNDGRTIERDKRLPYLVTVGPYEGAGTVIAEIWLEKEAELLAIEDAKHIVEGVVVKVYKTEPYKKPALWRTYLPVIEEVEA